MPRLLVSYDLGGPESGNDYAALYAALKGPGGRAQRLLESVWIVDTYKSAQQLRNDLAPYIDSNDQLLVFHVGGDQWAIHNMAGPVHAWLLSNSQNISNTQREGMLSP